MITPRSEDRAAAVFLATISSVSPRNRRRSEWPTITHWHRPLSIAGETSPVKAPDISQKQSCAPSSHGNGGTITTSTRSEWPRATERMPRARSRASSSVTGFIFQLAATSGIPGGRLLTPSRFFENRYAGQFLAFEGLEGCAPARRHVREAPRQAERIDRGHGVATTDEGEPARLRDGFPDRLRAVGEVLDLRDADWAVPDHSTRAANLRAEQRDAPGPDVERLPLWLDPVRVEDAERLSRLDAAGADEIDGQDELVAGQLLYLPRFLKRRVLNEARAGRPAARLEERVGHRPADEERIDLAQQVAQHAHLR